MNILILPYPGMHSTRAQSVLTVNDERCKNFLHYEFPMSMVNCTPGTFLYMDKVVEEVDGKEVIKANKRNCLVWTKPKYFVGSSGSVWASHLFEINRYTRLSIWLTIYPYPTLSKKFH